MATQINITPVKLTKVQKTTLSDYMTGKVGLVKTHERLGITKQRVYTMVAHIMRHSGTIGRINIEEILKDY